MISTEGHTHDESSPDRTARLSLAGARFEAIASLAGAAATRIVAGEVTYGAHADLQAATRNAAMMLDMDSAFSSYGWHESQARSDCTTGSDAMRENRWRSIDAILSELRGEAERWAATNARQITRFAELLFAADGYRLTGEPLHEALRISLAID